MNLSSLHHEFKAVDTRWRAARFDLVLFYTAEIFVLALGCIGVWCVDVDWLAVLGVSAVLYAFRREAREEELNARVVVKVTQRWLAAETARQSMQSEIREPETSGIHQRGVVAKAWN